MITLYPIMCIKLLGIKRQGMREVLFNTKKLHELLLSAVGKTVG